MWNHGYHSVQNLCAEFACFSSLLAIKMKATAFTSYFHFDALPLECGVDISRNFVCKGICKFSHAETSKKMG